MSRRRKSWLRELVVTDLERNGPVVDQAGRATQLLADRMGHHSSMSVRNVIRELVAEGAALRVVTRDGEAPRDGESNASPHPRRTYRIELIPGVVATRPVIEEEPAPISGEPDLDAVVPLPPAAPDGAATATRGNGSRPRRGVRLTGTRRRVLAALNDTPVDDPAGQAVQRLAARLGIASGDAFGVMLMRMDRQGLVERTVRGKRTYRLAITDLARSVADLPAPPPGWQPPAVSAQRRPSAPVKDMPDGPASTWGQHSAAPKEPAHAGLTQPAATALPTPASWPPAPPQEPAGLASGRAMRTTDRPTPGAWAAAAPPPGPVPLDSGSTERARTRLNQQRVEVLRALLGGGPIEDPAGHAMRILMGRTGRTDLSATHGVVAGMERAGLVRRTMHNRRVIRLEAIPEALSERETRLVWSTTAFPVATAPAVPPAPTRPSEVEALRDELAATRAELARVRLQLEMFRAWAKRMPGIDPSPDHLPPPADEMPAAGAKPTVVADDADANPPVVTGGAEADDQPRCQYVHPDSHADEARRGQPCGLRIWDGSRQWCWHHDPTPIRRRRAPVRRITSAA
jgi:hypothetical protein